MKILGDSSVLPPFLSLSLSLPLRDKHLVDSAIGS